MVDRSDWEARLDEAWSSFTSGEIAACTSTLRDLFGEMRTSANSLDTGPTGEWSLEADDLLDGEMHVGEMSRNVGDLETATEAYERVSNTSTMFRAANAVALSYYIRAQAKLALVEELRGAVTDGHLRLTNLHVLIATLREESESDSAVMALRLGDYVEQNLARFERVLGKGSRAKQLKAGEDPEPEWSAEQPIEDDAVFDDVSKAEPEDESDRLSLLARWPDPIPDAIDVPITHESGLDEYRAALAQAWAYIEEGRTSLDQERFDTALASYNEAFSLAEAISKGFKGAWYARDLLAIALLGRGRALEDLAFSEDGVRDTSMAAGILADQMRLTPAVRYLQSEHAWALTQLAWMKCRMRRPDSEIVALSLEALSEVKGLKLDEVWQPHLLSSQAWLEGHVAGHLQRQRRFLKALPHSYALARILMDFKTNDPNNTLIEELQRRAVNAAHGPFASFVRRNLGPGES